MRESNITDQVGHRMLGELAGAKILSPTMFNEAMRQWHEPQHEAFKPRTMWSLYNSCTEVIKRVPMERTFGVYKGLHDHMMNSIRTWIYR